MVRRTYVQLSKRSMVKSADSDCPRPSNLFVIFTAYWLPFKIFSATFASNDWVENNTFFIKNIYHSIKLPFDAEVAEKLLNGIYCKYIVESMFSWIPAYFESEQHILSPIKPKLILSNLRRYTQFFLKFKAQVFNFRTFFVNLTRNTCNDFAFPLNYARLFPLLA